MSKETVARTVVPGLSCRGNSAFLITFSNGWALELLFGVRDLCAAFNQIKDVQIPKTHQTWFSVDAQVKIYFEGTEVTETFLLQHFEGMSPNSVHPDDIGQIISCIMLMGG